MSINNNKKVPEATEYLRSEPITLSNNQTLNQQRYRRLLKDFPASQYHINTTQQLYNRNPISLLLTSKI